MNFLPKEIKNIINDYKNQLEHKQNFSKTLTKINSIKYSTYTDWEGYVWFERELENQITRGDLSPYTGLEIFPTEDVEREYSEEETETESENEEDTLIQSRIKDNFYVHLIFKII